MREQKYGELSVKVADSPEELGTEAAEVFATAIKDELAKADEITIIMALGAAQESFFAGILAREDIEWSRINVLHVDVYMGVADSDPRSGGSRLRRHLLDQVRPKAFYPMLGDTVPVEDELARYTELYQRLQPVLCIVGIGETGHLAFIDPPADFQTSSTMVAVPLAEMTRSQIAKAGIFATPDDVPRYGLSLTIPALVAPRHVIALVHEQDKAHTMKDVLEGPVSIMCPASILRTKPGAQLFLSLEAASDLDGFKD